MEKGDQECLQGRLCWPECRCLSHIAWLPWWKANRLSELPIHSKGVYQSSYRQTDHFVIAILINVPLLIVEAQIWPNWIYQGMKICKDQQEVFFFSYLKTQNKISSICFILVRDCLYFSFSTFQSSDYSWHLTIKLHDGYQKAEVPEMPALSDAFFPPRRLEQIMQG